jgi:release factor glutamine methyltransferase
MTDHYQRLCDELTDVLTFLPDKPEESVDATVRALWFLAAGEPRSAVRALDGTLPDLDSDATARLDGYIARRVGGEPLSHITKRQHFLGMDLLAGPEALVPRVETELLARTAIDYARELSTGGNSIHVLDVCTGSGNIALALAAHVPSARVFAADLDADAVELARLNAEHVGLAHRVDWRSGDLLAPFCNTGFAKFFDLIVCNPPYISSGKVGLMADEISAHEPRLAFDGGPLGVSLLMRLIDEAPALLKDGAWLGFEVGLGQGPSLARRLEKHADYSKVCPYKNHDDAVRTLFARRGSSSPVARSA